ncbi:MAG TPA: osmoprotectant, partial [Gemmatimonadales bacterium]|nr:osmoprotectant [Gemmatimonadales bacterium]
AANPEAILLDEPFGALDAITRAELQDGFDRLRRRLGITALFVTHDLGEAARLADVIVVLRAGRVEQRGSVRELRDSPATPYVRTLVERALAQGEPLRS